MTVTVLDAARRELSPGLAVRRALPVAACRSVGPFVFFDHFGPAALARAEDADVRPHPHIGLATVTWLFDGGILHRDSLGSVRPIRPGDVSWMLAGRGIVHSERAPDAHRGAPARLSILAGDAWGLRSPVPVASRTLYAVGTLEAGASVAMPDDHVERALYVVDGAVELDGVAVAPGRLATVDARATGRIRAYAAARIAIFGGAPLDGPRLVWWNFVSSDRGRIAAATARWRDDAFPRIEGETDRIPLPT